MEEPYTAVLPLLGLISGILMDVLGGLDAYIHTVHDTENLTFSADDRAENPHISARTISGFRADT